MKRSHRAQIGKETVEIVERGWYETAAGQRIDIREPVAACLAKTRLYLPDELEELAHTSTACRYDTQFEVTNETSLSAAYRVVVDHHTPSTLCLNFASAKNPGGGFLGGSQAQEESLARSSALYASLTSREEYYLDNRRCGTALYTDRMILSPDVPVFRNDDGLLLEEPYLLSIVTSPAVNAGAVRKNEPKNRSLIRSTMELRTSKLLALAADCGYEHLILGAWGCGVFRNDPNMVAELFANALLLSGPFHKSFRRVTFAVLDDSADKRIIKPFQKHFGEEM